MKNGIYTAKWTCACQSEADGVGERVFCPSFHVHMRHWRCWMKALLEGGVNSIKFRDVILLKDQLFLNLFLLWTFEHTVKTLDNSMQHFTHHRLWQGYKTFTIQQYRTVLYAWQNPWCMKCCLELSSVFTVCSIVQRRIKFNYFSMPNNFHNSMSSSCYDASWWSESKVNTDNEQCINPPCSPGSGVGRYCWLFVVILTCIYSWHEPIWRCVQSGQKITEGQCSCLSIMWKPKINHLFSFHGSHGSWLCGIY